MKNFTLRLETPRGSSSFLLIMIMLFLFFIQLSEQQQCAVSVDKDHIIDITNASNVNGYYMVPYDESNVNNNNTFFLIQICKPVTNVNSSYHCNSDTFKSIGYSITIQNNGNAKCQALTNTGTPTIKLLKNNYDILGISLSYAPFGVNNLFTGTIVDVYCNLTNNITTNIEFDKVYFKKKEISVITTIYYFEMYSIYGCPINGTFRQPISLVEFIYFHQQFLSIFISSIVIIGIVHFLVSLFSFRIFSICGFGIFIPILSFFAGCLYGFIQVLIYSLTIAGIYTSIGVTMSYIECIIFVCIIVIILLIAASGTFPKTRLQFF
ncbi:hypothetical protein ABK040_007180 [Willaertia magna]